MESGAAAAAITILLGWAVSYLLQALWLLVPRAAMYVATAISEFEVPYAFPMTRFELFIPGLDLAWAFILAIGAFTLSFWVGSVGPLELLAQSKTRITAKLHA